MKNKFFHLLKLKISKTVKRDLDDRNYINKRLNFKALIFLLLSFHDVLAEKGVCASAKLLHTQMKIDKCFSFAFASHTKQNCDVSSDPSKLPSPIMLSVCVSLCHKPRHTLRFQYIIWSRNINISSNNTEQKSWKSFHEKFITIGRCIPQSVYKIKPQMGVKALSLLNVSDTLSGLE